MILSNPLATQHKDLHEKMAAYHVACARGEFALRSNGTRVRVSELAPTQIEFIAGLWRVQNETQYQIRQIRDEKLILGKKLNRTEHTLFEFYQAMKPTFNCYGLIDMGFDMVVAKYSTSSGTFWGYGRTIEEARAFLGIKLYDQHQELINDVLNKEHAK